MISLAIPYHGDRSLWTLKTIENVHDIDEINEIIISVDKCPIEDKKLIDGVCYYKKVKVYTSDTILFAVRNKYKAVKNCKSDWVALIDSDNIIDKDYISKFLSLKKDINTIYQPSIGRPHLDYSSFVGTIIDRGWIKEHLNDKFVDMIINTGNYIFNREKWLEAMEGLLMSDYEPYAVDVAYSNYLCLKNNMKIEVVPKLEYCHTVHNNSTYVLFSKESITEYGKLKEMFNKL